MLLVRNMAATANPVPGVAQELTEGGEAEKCVTDLIAQVTTDSANSASHLHAFSILAFTSAACFHSFYPREEKGNQRAFCWLQFKCITHIISSPSCFCLWMFIPLFQLDPCFLTKSPMVRVQLLFKCFAPTINLTLIVIIIVNTNN